MRKPDFVIGPPAAPYLRRWWLIPRNRWFNVYLHEILQSDDDRALHCHPWVNLSIILKGAYREHMPGGISRVLSAGSAVVRRAVAAHRLEVARGPVWTLFITGPRIREWFFHCPKGLVHWKDFTATGNYGEVGRGCDQ